jgi:transcriptional regulator with XRE-family HTH domain
MRRDAALEHFNSHLQPVESGSTFRFVLPIFCTHDAKLARGVKGVNGVVKDFSHIFSERLRELRGSQSKSALGRFLGIPNPSTYHNYERGRVPDSRTVADIAQHCGVTVDWLLGRSTAPSGIAGEDQSVPSVYPSPRAAAARVRAMSEPCLYPGDATGQTLR